MLTHVVFLLLTSWVMVLMAVICCHGNCNTSCAVHVPAKFVCGGYLSIGCLLKKADGCYSRHGNCNTSCAVHVPAEFVCGGYLSIGCLLKKAEAEYAWDLTYAMT